MPAAATCLMCNARLSVHQARRGRFCDDPRCRWQYDRLPKDRVCAACGRPLAPRDLPDGACAAPACQRAVAADRQRRRTERERQRADALREQARRVRDRVASAAGIRDPASYPPAVIPAFAAAVTNLPDRRRRAFRDHVTRLIGRATAGRRAAGGGGDGPGPAPPPAVEAVLGRACACCQGDCCKDGGDHAYLTADTIRRYLDAHPGLRPRDVLAAYLTRVGHKTYRGSCVFHQPDGCALPREMRSDTCNQHFCDGLAAFRRDLPGAGPVRGFFASAAGGTVRAVAFIDEAEVRLVRRTGTGTSDVPGSPAES